MESFNLREIRNQLPLGGMADIASRMNISPIIVSAVLSKGRQGKYTNDIIAYAIELIKEKEPNPDVMKEASKMKLTIPHLFSIPRRRRNRNKTGYKDTSGSWFKNNPIVMVVIGLAFIMLLFGKRIFSALSKTSTS